MVNMNPLRLLRFEAELNNFGKSVRKFLKDNASPSKVDPNGLFVEGNWDHYMFLVSFTGMARNATAPYINEF
ncbi:hypothetical protein BGX34_002157 [Mortierella sp. NVP85]|nr:hypothetical protein BGX34_002157 [Mortierella sp. NVP85]